MSDDQQPQQPQPQVPNAVSVAYFEMFSDIVSQQAGQLFTERAAIAAQLALAQRDLELARNHIKGLDTQVEALREQAQHEEPASPPPPDQ